MGRFLTPLQVTATGEYAPDTRYGPGNPLFRLDAPLVYEADDGTRYEVPAGYVTDLASIPQQFQQRAPQDSLAAAPGALHDYLYTSHAMPRAEADRLFRQGLREAGLPLGQRLAMWGAVRLFGQPAYDARLGWAPSALAEAGQQTPR